MQKMKGLPRKYLSFVLALLLVLSTISLAPRLKVQAEEETYSVSYAFKSEDGTMLPDAVMKQLPPTIKVPKTNEGVNRQPSFESVIDKDTGWRFSGYTEPYDGGPITKDTVFTAIWKKETPKTVSFEFVSSDPAIPLPSELKNTEDDSPPGVLPKEEKHLVGDSVSVKGRFSPVQSGDYLWKFKSWSSNVVKKSFLIFTSYTLTVSSNDADNKAVGTWVPTRTYSVSYEFQPEDSAKELPPEVMALLPEKSGGHTAGSVVTPPAIDDVYTTENGKSVTWHLKAWNEESHTMTSDFTFVGTWESYTSYTVSYEYVYDPDENVPQALKDSLPKPTPGHKNGAVITGPTLDKTTYASEDKAKPGFWVFKGWETGKKVEGEDTVLKGTWKFEPATWKGTVTFDEHRYYTMTPATVPVTNPEPTDKLGFHDVWSNVPLGGFLPQYFVGWALKPNADPSKDPVFYPSQTYKEVFPNGIGDNPTLYEVRQDLVTMGSDIVNSKPYFNQYTEGKAGKATLPDETVKIAEAKGFDNPDAKERKLVAYYNKNMPVAINLNLSAGYDVPYGVANMTYINPNNIFFTYEHTSAVYLNVDLDSRINVADKPVNIFLKSYNFRPEAMLEGNVTQSTGSGKELVPTEGKSIENLSTAVKPNESLVKFDSDLGGLHQFSLKCFVRRERYGNPRDGWGDVKEPYQITATPEQVHQPIVLYTDTPDMFTVPKSAVLEIAKGDKEALQVKGSIYMFLALGRGSLGQKLDAVPLQISFRFPEVTFDKNDGDTAATPEKVKVIGGDSINNDELQDQSMPANPTRKGYTFLGWSTNKDATTPDFDGDTIVNEDITVYAVWKSNKPNPNPGPKPGPGPIVPPYVPVNPTPGISEPCPSDKPGETCKKDEVPKTGEHSQLPLAATYLALAAALILARQYRRRREHGAE